MGQGSHGPPSPATATDLSAELFRFRAVGSCARKVAQILPERSLPAVEREAVLRQTYHRRDLGPEGGRQVPGSRTPSKARVSLWASHQRPPSALPPARPSRDTGLGRSPAPPPPR